MTDAAAQRRARQTVINLALSLAATLGIVLLLVLIVPRDDSNRIKPVDYKDIAAGAVETTGLPLIVPETPGDGWWSNSAKIRTSPTDGTAASWTAGFVGPNNEFIGFSQTFTTNPTWLALQLSEKTQTGTYDESWQIFEATKPSKPAKTRDYILVMNEGQDTVLVYGTAQPQVIQSFADKVKAQIQSVYP
jgi:hypothetical protein